MDNYDMIRTSEVAQGATCSRSQPDFNLPIVKGIQLAGINTIKLLKFIEGELGIKIASDRNLHQQITKVGKWVKCTYDDCKIQNRKEHVLSVRESEKYCCNIRWNSNGEHHFTSAGCVCIDGAGCPHIYNNGHLRR